LERIPPITPEVPHPAWLLPQAISLKDQQPIAEDWKVMSSRIGVGFQDGTINVENVRREYTRRQAAASSAKLAEALPNATGQVGRANCIQERIILSLLPSLGQQPSGKVPRSGRLAEKQTVG